MKHTSKKKQLYFILGVLFLLVFILFTVLLKVVDVAPASPDLSVVGFSALNRWFFENVGTHDTAYTVSEALGMLILCVPVVFGLVLLLQWIKRKSLWKADRDLYALFGVYVLTVAAYVLFEIFVINRRPVLMDGILEASYPSSHSLLAIVIGGTAIEQIGRRVSILPVKIALQVVIATLSVGTCVFRLLSGVHWVTDILGAIILGMALIFFYLGLSVFLLKQNP